MPDPGPTLARWQAAGLLDEPTAARIRAWEASQARPAGRQWQVLLALILGGILLGAGILLFVAAHWDNVSPAVRFALVLGMLVFFHLLGLVTRTRFDGFATAMHALGTIATGAAIALTGQIFNMQEHWPAAILLWAIAAAAGWLLLGDQIQQTLALLLVPAWLASEFGFRLRHYLSGDIYMARLGLVIGAAYLTAFLHSRRRAVFGILFAVGALLLPICTVILTEGWRSYGWNEAGSVPLRWRVVLFLLVAGVAAAACFADRLSLIPIAVAVALGMALPWAQTRSDLGINGVHSYDFTGPNVLAYALVALATLALVFQGVRTSSKALVNYGLAAFAATVAWFYFSSVMDKLNRSLGLIVLGVLFLGGGWLLERTRRSLLANMEAGHALT